MFRRKLFSLDHINPDSFNINEEQSVRQLVVWLEDQKIRHYKIDNRRALKQTDEPGWPSTLKRYLSDLECPHPSTPPAPMLDWLLALAIMLEYADKRSDYNEETAERVTSRRNEAPQVVNTNPLDALDFTSQEFRAGIQKMAAALKIPDHPDHLVTLKAVSHLVSTRLTQEAINNRHHPEGTAYPIFSADLGFDMGDECLNNAAKALRLLYIQDMRALQTSINECIAATQTVTANPKTDSRLGRVGR